MYKRKRALEFLLEKKEEIIPIDITIARQPLTNGALQKGIGLEALSVRSCGPRCSYQTLRSSSELLLLVRGTVRYAPPKGSAVTNSSHIRHACAQRYLWLVVMN